MAPKDLSEDPKFRERVKVEHFWKCPKCGHFNPDSAKFCANCGWSELEGEHQDEPAKK